MSLNTPSITKPLSSGIFLFSLSLTASSQENTVVFFKFILERSAYRKGSLEFFVSWVSCSFMFTVNCLILRFSNIANVAKFKEDLACSIIPGFNWIPSHMLHPNVRSSANHRCSFCSNLVYRNVSVHMCSEHKRNSHSLLPNNTRFQVYLTK